MMMPTFSFMNRKKEECSIRFILVPFTKRHFEIRLGAKDLFKTKWINNPNIFCLGRFVLHESCAPIKEHHKQKHETMCNFLKNFVLDAFEICKAKLKGDDKLEIDFYLYSFYIFPK
ncbi:hypothetical protein [Bartonella queenslandensis]|uniref:hypothetical protein n=1 Tax=Bartonella queenslandensis TaxID=481138 RepID=UPI0006873EF3|nr:hypothetical protein [Bartonella queenslandensis]